MRQGRGAARRRTPPGLDAHNLPPQAPAHAPFFRPPLPHSLYVRASNSMTRFMLRTRKMAAHSEP